MKTYIKCMFFVGFWGLEGVVWKLFGFMFGVWRLLEVWLRAAGCYLEAWWLDVGAGWLEGGGRGLGGWRGGVWGSPGGRFPGVSRVLAAVCGPPGGGQ